MTARNRSKERRVVRVMTKEEKKTKEQWEDVPATQRCVYVQDRDSQRWSAQIVTVTGITSAEQLR